MIMRHSKKRINGLQFLNISSISGSVWNHHSIFCDVQSCLPSMNNIIRTNEKSSTSFTNVSTINVEQAKNVFLSELKNYDVENGELAENCLENLVGIAKNIIFDELLFRAEERDTSFFIKFIDCYRFSNSNIDEELVAYLTRYCFESDDYLMQLSGINLLSTKAIRNRSIIKSANKVTNPYLKHKLLLALQDE